MGSKSLFFRSDEVMVKWTGGILQRTIFQQKSWKLQLFNKTKGLQKLKRKQNIRAGSSEVHS